MFNKEGYLEKEMKIVSLDTEGINPTLDEITKFTGGAINENEVDLAELSITSGSAVPTTDDFYVGEHVEVTNGELINLHGVVKSIDNEIINIEPADGSLETGLLSFAANQLRKRFLEGDHVKVINGKHKDETGLVIKISNSIVTIVSDLTLKEIVVFSKDLRAATEITSTVSVVGQYDIHDLVHIGYNNVGVIIKIDRDMCRVLDNYGKIQNVSFKRLGQKLTRKPMGTDAHGNTIAIGDTVQTSGLQKKKGIILHIYRGLVFMYSREYTDNEGVFYEKSENVVLISGKGVSNINNKDNDGFAKPFGSFKNNFQHNGRNGGNNRFNRRRRNDSLAGKTVTISRGPFKGYLGIVKDSNEEQVRVELHTNSKVVSVPRDNIQIQGENYAASGNNNYGNYSGRISDGGRTPMYSGAKTPSYRYDGSTPNPYSDGSKTPAWDAGSRTPGYNMGSKTPAWDADSTSNNRPTPSYSGSNYSSSIGENQSSNFSRIPATPAYGAVATPGDVETPYNPATPAPFTPSIPQTPGGIPSTPGPLYPNAGSARPTTPFTPSEFTPGTQFTNPATPFMPTGGDYALSELDELLPTATDDWATEEIEVVIVPNKDEKYSYGVYDGQHGVIEKVDNHVCQVILDQNNSNMSIPTKFLEPVCPDQKKQQVKVIMGKYKNQIGNLHSIDGPDGIVRMFNASDIKCMNLKALAKYRPIT